LIKLKIDCFNKEHKFKILLVETVDSVKYIHTATNDGYLTTWNISDIKDNYLPFDRRIKGYSNGTAIKEIIIEDFAGNNTSIYKNLGAHAIDLL